MGLRGVIAMALVSLVAASVGQCSAKVSNLYVATNGRDNWSGRLAAPNKARTDGPLATIQGARDAIRRLKENGPLKNDVTVYIRKGTYFLPKSLELTSEDSGSRESGITYEAYHASGKAEAVTISAGVPVTGFKAAKANGHDVIVASVPKVKAGEWYPTQLFVNERRADRTRLPKTGYYNIKSAPTEEDWQKGQNSFTFNPEEISAKWRNMSDVDIVALTLWIETRMPIKSVDESANIVQLAKKSTFWLVDDHNKGLGARYWIENVYEALDTPGQWYMDRAQGLLYYYPRPGENWRKAKFVLSGLENVIRITGTAEKPVENVVFRNLRFAHAQHTLPAQKAGSVQAAVDVPGAVLLTNASGIGFDHCEVSQIGNYAIEFGDGCRDCLVSGCSIHDLGAGGVKIGHGAQAIQVSDNEITEGGKVFASAEGVWIGNSPHNKVLHNLISDFNYTGVSVGWVWGYGKSNAFDNLVSGNHIHHIGRGVLSDLGGIYTLGISPGTVLSGNLIHDCQSHSYGGWGIYTDEGSSDILITKNVVYNTKTGGFHQHYGKENTVTNNVFAFAAEQQLQRTRVEEHTSFTFEKNIVYFDSGELLGGNWSGDQYVMDNNIYFNAAGKPITFQGASLEEWRKRGHDAHSKIVDPGFVDPAKRDFGLRPDSPALKMGFQPIDLSKVGPRQKAGIE